MVKLACLIPVLPFCGFLINVLFGRRLKGASAPVAILTALASLCLSVLTLLAYLDGEGSFTILTWLPFGGKELTFGVIVDPLTIMMLLVVTTVGSMIFIYSVGYMRGDPRFSRFFAYLSLFLGSMLGLVLADNFIMLYIFWEGVGVCSYLLISFWFEKPQAARAGMKAFITTRIGDTGMFIGILVLFFTTGTVSLTGLSSVTGSQHLLTLAAVLIFCGAAGKSAQFPLHVWLPDAMEGPTPVSALIHAATMVAAGVYLVARTFFFFQLHAPSLLVVGYIGAITSLMAATIALVNNDIKRVLAYSTISQLGFMMLGLGAGGYTAGTFHLMTHAFFKALLFMCAGSVIHAVHTQDIREMGGLFRKMKVTGTTFVIGALAIAGVPPLSGFWSKDEVLSEALHNGRFILFAAGVAVSFLTAFYMFRLIFLTLFGKPRRELHAHESPLVMTIPLIVLAAFSVFAGLTGSPLGGHVFQNFIMGHGEHAAGIKPDYLVMGVSTLVALTAISVSYVFYVLDPGIPEGIKARFSSLHRLLSNKYYFDELYGFLFIRPCLRLSRLSFKFDLGIIDAAANACAAMTASVSNMKAFFDLKVVDGVVNGVASAVSVFSSLLRHVHTGRVQNYLLIAFSGLLVITLIKLIGG